MDRSTETSENPAEAVTDSFVARDQPSTRPKPATSTRSTGIVRVPASVPVALRGLGVACLVLACLVVVAAMMGLFLNGLTAFLAVLVILLLAAIPAAAVVTAVMRIQGRGAHFSYSSEGFDNRTALIGIGQKRARWSQVNGLEVQGETLVIDLDGDHHSIVHARVLGFSPESIAHAIRPLLGRPF
jgi:hypothetical protein